MANLDITEYSQVGYVGLGLVPVADATSKLASQSIAIGGSSVQSAAFNAKTKLIRVHAEALCAVEIGTDATKSPTAVAPNGRMAANQTEYFVVAPSSLLAVITST